jgi:hypothetical protein
MSTTSRINNGSTPSAPRRSYITTAAYANDIYSYETTFTFPTYGGVLTPLGAGVVTPNVAGTILRETGRKLFPGVNPGVSTYMVGVFHPSFGNGFIDPNSPKFAVYNSDKPYYMADGVDPATSLKDEGMPVYTRGTVTADGDITTSSSISATGNVVAGGQIRSSTVTTLTPGANVVINPALGQVFKLNTNQNTNITAVTPNNLPGAVIYVIVQGDAGGRTIDFNAGFRTVNLGVRTVGAGLATFSFVSDGTNFIQIGEAITLAQ